MQAMTREQYGAPTVLQLKKMPRPAIGDDEVLVKVHAASVNPYDWHELRGSPFVVRLQKGWFKPKQQKLGVDMAGVVEAVGRNVMQFRQGDAVFGMSGRGAFAEYTCVAEKRLVHKPDSVSFAEAAAVPMAALTALQALRDNGRFQAGQNVLVIGGGGGVGSFAIQLAKALGGTVTAVCSTQKAELVRSLGADAVVDYTKDDVTTLGQQYDLILDTAAYRSFLPYRNILAKNGRYVLVGGSLLRGLHMMLLGRFLAKKEQQFSMMLAKTTKEDLETLQAFLANGQIKPMLGNHYPLPQLPEALAYVEEGHATGKVIIEMAIA